MSKENISLEGSFVLTSYQVEDHSNSYLIGPKEVIYDLSDLCKFIAINPSLEFRLCYIDSSKDGETLSRIKSLVR